MFLLRSTQVSQIPGSFQDVAASELSDSTLPPFHELPDQTSKTDGVNPIALRGLQSEDQRQLLDDIDKLHSEGISNYIDLPRLIVCGNQSSGKSSVLEALSLVRFPTKGQRGTRFAIELVLRRTLKTRSVVTIKPADSRTEEEKKRLLQFEAQFTSGDDLPGLIAEASQWMGLSSDGFSEDVLCVESSGPDRPHLTLVDLPGLISFHKIKTEIGKPLRMVKDYMSKDRSIILAVVSASSDFDTQSIIQEAKKYDPERARTLGIITKPDSLLEGTLSEKAWIDLANNKEIPFRLGWHVLKNRDEKSPHLSSEERDQSEAEFLSQGAWAFLHPDTKGISALRTRLNKVLLEHIRSDLPAVLEDIQTKLADCKDSLLKMGHPRPTAKEQRVYLLQISVALRSLVEAAVKGTYSDAFFGPTDVPGEDRKRLRAIIRNLNDKFVLDMRKFGRYQRIISDDSQSGTSVNTASSDREVSRRDYIRQIHNMARMSRGCELPGTLSSPLIEQLFHKQTEPWGHIAAKHLEGVWQSTKDFLQLALDSAASTESCRAILRKYIYPLMEEKRKVLQEKLTEILRPYQSGPLITLHSGLTRKVKEIKDNRYGAGTLDISNGVTRDIERTLPATVPNLVDELASDEELGIYVNEYSDVIDLMDAYYEIAFGVFVDNVATLVIENCLLGDLPKLFTYEDVGIMDDDELKELAGESDELTSKRAQLLKKVSVLERGLSTLHSQPTNKQQPGVSTPRNVDHNQPPQTARTSAVPDQQPLSTTTDKLNPSERQPNSPTPGQQLPSTVVVTSTPSERRSSTPAPSTEPSSCNSPGTEAVSDPTNSLPNGHSASAPITGVDPVPSSSSTFGPSAGASHPAGSN